MSNLKTLLVDLQQQLQDALCAPCSSTSNGARLQADRATLSLKLALEPSPINLERPEQVGFALLPLPSVASFTRSKTVPTEHTLTIEYRIDSPGAVPSISPVSITAEPSLPVPSAPAQPPEANEVAMTILTQALGAPGFDSSARATVFCEAMSELDEAQRVAIWNCLGDTRPGAVIDPALKRARHRLRGVLRSGPGGTQPTTSAPLASLFARQRSSELLDLIRTRWKTQADWL